MFGRADFQRNAEECLRLAEASPSPAERLALLRMAESWKRMVGHAERIAHLVGPDLPSAPGIGDAAAVQRREASPDPSASPAAPPKGEGAG